MFSPKVEKARYEPGSEVRHIDSAHSTFAGMVLECAPGRVLVQWYSAAGQRWYAIGDLRPSI